MVRHRKRIKPMRIRLFWSDVPNIVLASICLGAALGAYFVTLWVIK